MYTTKIHESTKEDIFSKISWRGGGCFFYRYFSFLNTRPSFTLSWKMLRGTPGNTTPPNTTPPVNPPLVYFLHQGSGDSQMKFKWNSLKKMKSKTCDIRMNYWLTRFPYNTKYVIRNYLDTISLVIRSAFI